MQRSGFPEQGSGELVESPATRRRQIQHAANGGFPHTDTGSAGMRRKFELPPDRPLNPRENVMSLAATKERKDNAGIVLTPNGRTPTPPTPASTPNSTSRPTER